MEPREVDLDLVEGEAGDGNLLQFGGVAQSDECHAAEPGLPRVAALRNARHHHAAPVLPSLAAAVDMAERPVVEAVTHQVRQAAGRIRVMSCRPVEGGMHQAHVAAPCRWGRITGQRALVDTRRVKAEAVEIDARECHSRPVMAEQMDVLA